MDRIQLKNEVDKMSIESVFPELEQQKTVKQNKWGILDVCLTKCDNVTTGYQWKYSYFDGVKIKVLSSYDLIKLRQKVDNRGLPWTITDSKLAIDSYKLNKSSSGVRYVYRTPDKGSRRGFYWIYVNNHHEGQKSYTSNSLLRLKERIESEGLKWTVVNQKLYKKLLNQEKDFV